MKKMLFVAVLSLLVMPRPAGAMIPPVLTFGCAPWDGRTLDMNIAAPDALYRIQIWGKGFEDLMNGERTIVIDIDGGQVDGAGRANVLPTALEGAIGSSIALTVYFDELDLKDGGVGAGYIEVHDGFRIPFRSTITGSQLCG
ncbi:MAG TPA: hypothetical protein PKI93_05250 [Alphaproteobacteria bacterium]|nr:hypothetical protein [Alphaproteobacteria bacterium]HNS44651.1 hypothetical protein [Alphaproteobacteria bacterium]